MKSLGTAVAAVGVACLAVGLIWPWLAPTLLRGFVVVLGLAYVGARLYGSHLPDDLATDVFSPFDRVAPDPRPSATPEVVRRLSTLLQAADDDQASQRASIPEAARHILASEATRRLTEHHGLSLRRPEDHGRIQALVSDATWSLLRPARRATSREPVAIALLDPILDDVERL